MKHNNVTGHQLSIFESVGRVRVAVDKNSGDIIPPAGNFRADLAHGMAWCPYCAFYMLFAWDPRLHEPRCPGCSVSAQDFYISKINRLVTTDDYRDFAAAVRRAGLRHDRPLFFERDGD